MSKTSEIVSCPVDEQDTTKHPQKSILASKHKQQERGLQKMSWDVNVLHRARMERYQHDACTKCTGYNQDLVCQCICARNASAVYFCLLKSFKGCKDIAFLTTRLFMRFQRAKIYSSVTQLARYQGAYIGFNPMLVMYVVETFDITTLQGRMVWFETIASFARTYKMMLDKYEALAADERDFVPPPKALPDYGAIGAQIEAISARGLPK